MANREVHVVAIMVGGIVKEKLYVDDSGGADEAYCIETFTSPFYQKLWNKKFGENKWSAIYKGIEVIR